MNILRTISRLFVATAIIFSGTMSAVFNKSDVESKVKNNAFVVTSTFVEDMLAKKNEHGRRAFINTVGHSLDKKLGKKDITAEEFTEHFLINYSIRKGGQILHDRGILPDTDAIVKKVDVLPQGIIRDIVNPVVEGTVEVATHPETLTLATMYVLQNYVIPALTK